MTDRKDEDQKHKETYEWHGVFLRLPLCLCNELSRFIYPSVWGSTQFSLGLHLSRCLVCITMPTSDLSTRVEKEDRPVPGSSSCSSSPQSARGPAAAVRQTDHVYLSEEQVTGIHVQVEAHPQVTPPWVGLTRTAAEREVAPNTWLTKNTAQVFQTVRTKLLNSRVHNFTGTSHVY